MTRFVFLADPQLGCRATFSGLDGRAVESLRRRDIHIKPFPPVDGHAWDRNQLESAVKAVNDVQPDFVVFGGDMIDDARSEAQHASLLEAVALLDPSIPIHWVSGNHDCAYDGEQPTHLSVAHYLELFGPDRYAFQVAEASFIVLNTSLLHRPERVRDLCEAQMAFLRSELEAAAQRAGPTILFGHHPLFLTRHDEPDSYWNIPMGLRRDVLDAIEAFDVTAMFSGHYHRNNIAHAGPFEMVTSGPVGFPLGQDPSGIRIVEIAGSRITHTYVPLS